jgi:hypothetical protein
MSHYSDHVVEERWEHLDTVFFMQDFAESHVVKAWLTTSWVGDLGDDAETEHVCLNKSWVAND